MKEGAPEILYPADRYVTELKENTSERGGGKNPTVRMNLICPTPEGDSDFFEREVHKIRMQTALCFRGPTLELLRLDDSAAVSSSFLGWEYVPEMAEAFSLRELKGLAKAGGNLSGLSLLDDYLIDWVSDLISGARGVSERHAKRMLLRFDEGWEKDAAKVDIKLLKMISSGQLPRKFVEDVGGLEVPEKRTWTIFVDMNVKIFTEEIRRILEER